MSRPAGRAVSDVLRNALMKFTFSAAVPSFAPAGNDVRAEPFHALVKLLPLLKSKAGKLVSPLYCHALVKFTLLAAVPSCAPAGNDVRAVQERHALVKAVPLLMSSAGNDVSDELRYHA